MNIDGKYDLLTKDGAMNFIGAVDQFYPLYESKIDENTDKLYESRYNNLIFPCVDKSKPIDEYTTEDLEDLLEEIRENANYKDISLETNIRHLVSRPVLTYYSLNKSKDDIRIWGNGFEYKGTKDNKSSLLVLKRSIQASDELKIAEYLDDPKTLNGEDIGLAIMFYSAVRNAEACGLNFYNLKEMRNHEGSYYIQVYQTTKIKSNKLKLGGKTYNAPRQLPILDRLAKLLIERKKYLESLYTFPYTDKNGVIYNSVEEMPIVCRGNNHFTRSSADDLSIAGRHLLRDKLKYDSKEVSELSYYINDVEVDENSLGEKDPTTYLLRRNMGTHLYTLGFETGWSQYYMGHAIDSEPIQRYDRADEEFLYKLWKILQKHPLNNYSLVDNKYTIKASANAYSVQIKNKELNDQITILFSDSEIKIKVQEKHFKDENKNVVDITSLIRYLYK